MKSTDKAKALIESLMPLQKSPIAEVFPCPRCGYDKMKQPAIKNALSRRANVYICSTCGVDEAMLDSQGKEPISLDEWAMVMSFNLVFNKN